jgi:hypothetical protein
MHWRRRTRHGSHDKPTRARLPLGTKRKAPGGYVLTYRPDLPEAHHTGYMLEHRVVMREYLGRPLEDSEAVHHKNAIRNDNRLENLELWVGRGMQPSGARASDLVPWAREIIARYGDAYDSGQL